MAEKQIPAEERWCPHCESPLRLASCPYCGGRTVMVCDHCEWRPSSGHEVEHRTVINGLPSRTDLLELAKDWNRYLSCRHSATDADYESALADLLINRIFTHLKPPEERRTEL